MLYFTLFVLSRFLIIQLSIILLNFQGFQVQLLNLICMAFTTWIIIVKPHSYGPRRSIEYFNRLMILCISYSLFLFTDFNTNPVFQYQVCYFQLSVLSLLVAVNMTYILQNAYQLKKIKNMVERNEKIVK